MPQPAEILFSDTPCSPLHEPWHSSSGIPSNTSFISTVVHGSERREQDVGTMNGQGCDRKVGKREEANLETGGSNIAPYLVEQSRELKRKKDKVVFFF
jgi:hypothetical protein